MDKTTGLLRPCNNYYVIMSVLAVPPTAADAQGTVIVLTSLSSLINVVSTEPLSMFQTIFRIESWKSLRLLVT